MGRRFPQQLSDSSHARERAAGSASARVAEESEQSRTAFRGAILGLGSTVVRAVHVGRKWDRIRPEAQPCAGGMVRSVEAGMAKSHDDAGRSGGGAGRMSQET